MTNQPLPPDKRAIAGKWLTRILLCVTVELGCLLIADTLHLQFQPEPPAQLSEAELQEAKNLLGVNLTPEELTSIELTDAMRDRLIADPRLKPILQSIHEDVLSVNWGGSGAKEPLWVKYGAKAFPVLDYYTQSSDPTRRSYGIYGIRKLGKPYTTLWLKKQIKRQTPINPAVLGDIEGDWKAEFGLDNPQMRQEIIQLARKDLASNVADHSNLDDPYYYHQPNPGRFNRFLVNQLTSPAELEREQQEREQAYRQEDEKKWKSTRQLYEITQQKIHAQKKRWQRWTKLKRLNAQQQQQAMAEYDALLAEAQVGVIDNGFEVKRGKLSAVEKLLARRVMRDERSPYQLLATLVLDFHRDAEARQPIRDFFNGDLHKTEPFTGNPNFRLVLESIHKRYPDTRYAQSCREYGDLTGRTYFGSGFRSVAMLRRIEQKTPAQRVADWQDWLNRYPDHPGADDATEHLALSLLAQGEGVAAAHQWIRLMTRSLGDGDARFRGYRRLRVLLDVGLTTAQIQTLLKEPDVAPIAPLLRYALAVHLARDQAYSAALKVSNGIDLTRIPYQFLRNYSYFNDKQDDSYGKEYFVTAQQKMQATLTEQRQRWQQLYRWQQENTAAGRYAIASDWADPAGWKNGYLALWIGQYDGDRWRTLPTVSSSYDIQSKDIKERFRYGSYFGGCRQWWVCDTARRGEQTVRGAYQKGNPNAVALSLYERLLHNPQTPAAIKEKTLYMEAVTLAAQLLYFERGEAQTIHPPAGVMASPRKQVPDYSGSDNYHLEFAILGDYQRRIDRIVAQLQQQFPKSRYTDDLLMSNYFLGRQKRYLEQVVKRYPHSDRVDEARYLLGRNDWKNTK